jgi:hypothetical protein
MMFKLALILFALTYSIDSLAVGVTIVTALITAEIIAAGIAASMIAMAINMAVAAVISKAFFSPNQPSSAGGADALSGGSPNPGNRQQIAPATDNKIPVVYGTAWVGGTIVDLSITSDNQKLYYCLALTEVTNSNQGQTPDTITFGTIYYGGKRVVFDPTEQFKVIELVDESTGIVDTSIAGKINIYLYSNGSNSPTNSSQSAISLMNSAGLTYTWANSKLFTNCAFAIVQITYSQTANVRGIEQTKFQVTNSRNSAGDCIQDYLINTRYGAALPLAQINTASLTALNTYSNQNFTYTTYTGSTTTQPRFKFNGTVDTNRTVMDNLQDMSSCCDALIKYNEVTAQWGVIVQSPTYTVAMALTDSNIVSAISVSPTDISASYNFIECKFPDSTNQDAFNASNFDLAQIAPTLLYPNEPVNKISLSLPFVNNNVQAQYIANRVLKSAREDLIVQADTNFIGIQLDAGDIVTVTNANYGWTNKLFRLNKVNQTFTDNGAIIVKLSMSEFNPAVFDDVNITQFTPSVNTGIGSPLFFGTIPTPIATDAGRFAAEPYISVDITTPTSGIVQYSEIWYSAFQFPTDDQRVFAGTTQVQSSGNPYPAGAVIPTAFIVNIPAGNWYFFSRMVNSLGKSVYSPASTLLRWTPQTFQYVSRYVLVAYGTSNVGAGFSLNPRTKTYYGILNSDTGNPSLVASDYTWYLAVPESFGTDNYVIFSNRGNRKFTFAVDNAATSGVGGAFVPTETSVYDPTLWSGLPDGTNVIDLDARTGQLTKVGTSSISSADGLLSVTNNTQGTMVVSLQKFLNFGNGVYSRSLSPSTLTVDVYGRVVGFTSEDDFFYSDYVFTATAGQTSFSVTHALGQALVFKNGILLPTSDYTETTSTIVLDTACAVGEIVEVIAMRVVSALDTYDDLGITVATAGASVTYAGLPFQALSAGDQLTFANTGTPTIYTIATVNMTTKVITFTASPTEATVGDGIYIFTAENAEYKPFVRYEFDVTAINSLTPTLIGVQSGFEQIYVNGAQFNEIDYDLTSNTFSGFPAPVTGKVELILFAPSNLGIPCSNITNTVAYTVSGSLTYNFPNNPLAMQVYANGTLLAKGAGYDYTPNASGYNLAVAYPNNFTLLNQQTFARIGAA